MDFKVFYALVLFVTGCCSQRSGEQDRTSLKDTKKSLKEPEYKPHGNGSESNSVKNRQSFKTSFQNLGKDSVRNETIPIRNLGMARSELTSQKYNMSYSRGTTQVERGPIISVKLLHGEDSAISISDASSRKRLPEILKKDNLNVYSIDYVYNEILVFFTAHDRIFRATLEGRSNLSNIEAIVATEVDGPVRLAVDWIHEKLYWMADKYQTVMMANLDGTSRRLLFDNIRNFSYPNNMVVDPYKGLLFFVSDYSLHQSDLHGENATTVVIEGNMPGEEGRGIRCVALDRSYGKLYFSGKNHPGSETPYYLARANYDGSDVEDFNTAGLNDVYSMEVLGDTLYFAEHKDHVCHDEIMSASTKMDEFHPLKLFVPSRCQSNLWGIKAFHPCVQKPLDDKYCSTLFNN